MSSSQAIAVVVVFILISLNSVVETRGGRMLTLQTAKGHLNEVHERAGDPQAKISTEVDLRADKGARNSGSCDGRI